MHTEFRIPDLGENIDSGEVVKLLVNVGDEVKPEQPLMELETGKAVVEVPADTAGRITQILIAEGDHVSVGQAVFALETDAVAASPKPAQPVVAPTPAPAAPPPSPVQPIAPPAPVREPSAIPAAPNVRRLARELGVELAMVKGSGPDGHISEGDVRAAASKVAAPPPTAVPVFTSPLAGAQSLPGAPVSLPDFSRYGRIERKPMSSVRLATAQHLLMAWTAIPQVTQYDSADITVLNDLRKRYGPGVEAAGGKLTVTAVLVKVVASALRQFPHFNASVDMAAREIIEKDYVHVGVAVNTERGLLVPVIRDADRKNIMELAVELARATTKAHNRELKPADLEGGTFSITNLGTIGGTHFTPIVNWPEVAILGISRARNEPVWREDKFVPRLMLPLSLSYDHRVIDGADGARFLRWICEALEQPFFLALEG
jgi:pyruvate dehydrogenase E2 component (dihydrolipoamide acetyltransferase)